MNPWWQFLMMLSLQTTIVSCVALGLCRLVKSRATWRHAIGLFSLLAIASSPLTVSLLPQSRWIDHASRHHSPSMKPSSSAPTIDVLAETISQSSRKGSRLLGESLSTERNVERQSSQPLSHVPSTEASAGKPLNGGQSAETWAWNDVALAALSGIWLIGMICQLVRIARAQASLHRIEQTALRIQLPFAILSSVQRSLGASAANQLTLVRPKSNDWIKAIPIYQSPLAPMPMVLGVIRQRIILPESMRYSPFDPHLRSMLVHEYAHIQRGDIWVHGLQQILKTFFWWHPAIHLVSQTVSDSREEICDNYVLRTSDRIEYAETLLAFAEQFSKPRAANIGLGLFARSHSLEDRIAGLLTTQRQLSTTTRWPVRIAIAGLFLTITWLVGGVSIGQGNWLSSLISSTYFETSFIEPGFDDDSEIVVLTDDRASKKVDLRGMCVDQLGQPLEAAQLRLYRRPLDSLQAPKLIAECHSQSDGTYAFRDVQVFSMLGVANGPSDLLLLCTLQDFSSQIHVLQFENLEEATTIQLTTDTDSLTGKVSDENGKPVEGAKVSLAIGLEVPIEDFSATTSKDGSYSLDNLRVFGNEKQAAGPKETITSFLYVYHPDYATTRAGYQKVPQEVDVQMEPACFIQGRVIDRVTGKRVANAEVNAQGVGASGWASTRTNGQGEFRLKVAYDYYNIWSEMSDRVCVAAKAIEVPWSGTISDIELPMVEGGMIVGKLIDSATDKPVRPDPDRPLWIAHHGPAKPMTGAAVGGTLAEADGSFRLRVAPGKNYVYRMDGGASVFVEASDGQIVLQDLHTGREVAREELESDPDWELRRELTQQFWNAKQSGGIKKRPTLDQSPFQDDRVAKKLAELQKRIVSLLSPADRWLTPMKDLAEMGHNAVPDLITALDQTNDDLTIRSLAFTLRAIGDPRAVPALIRTIPKTLIPPGSDMGCFAKDASLVKFAQAHDLDPQNGRQEFGFGRPVREVFGAIHSLTQHRMQDEELYHIFDDGTLQQRKLKREVFQRSARNWARWWDANASRFTKEESYLKTDLKLEALEAKEAKLSVDTPLKADSGGSNWILESVFADGAETVFFDIDTGRVSSLPKQWAGKPNLEDQMDEIANWAQEEGFDMMGSEYLSETGADSCYSIQNLSMQLWELPKNRWKWHPDGVTAQQLQDEGTRIDDVLMHYNEETNSYEPKSTGTFYYLTRDGSPGLLYLGIEVTNDQLQAGGATGGDLELSPIAFDKGRRLGFTHLVPK